MSCRRPIVRHILARLDTARRLASTRLDRRDDAGFVVVEVLVSLIIFAIVSAGATVAIIGALNADSTTRSRVGATNLAQQAIQRAEEMTPAVLAATPSTTATTTMGSDTYTVTRQITFSPAGSTACPTAIATDAPHAMVVHVVVTGKGTNARSVTMDTVISC